MKPWQIVLGLVLSPLVLALVALLVALLLLYILVWILPGFGYCYERRAVRRHYEQFYPHGKEHSFIPLHAMQGKKVHVKQTLITAQSATTATPTVHVVVFPGAAVTIAATDFITRDVKTALLDYSSGGQLVANIRLIQYEHVSYGYSEPIEQGEKVDLSGEAICRATHELLCLMLDPATSTSTASSTHPPVIAWGQSYGGQLAQLYRYLYPQSVSALLLVDPSPTTLFAPSAPMGSMMNKAAFIYSATATVAATGFIRPIAALMQYSSGEVREAMAVMPREYVGQIFSASHLRAMAREFTGFKLTCQQLEEQYSAQPQPTDVPLRMVSAMRFSQLYGGRTHEETGAWWKEAQKRYLQSSTAAVHDVQDRTHVQVCTDGVLQGVQLKVLVNQTAAAMGRADSGKTD